MAELGLFPDPQLVVAQGVVYLCAVLSANYFIIQPALRLNNERKRRTSGAVDSAKAEEARAESLEHAYTHELKVRTEEVRSLRVSEILAGQAEAESILAIAQEKARTHLGRIQGEVEASVAAERAKIPSLIDDVVSTIFTQLGVNAGLLFVSIGAAVSAVSQTAFGAGGGHVELWSGIIWPYFQFACFVAGLVFLGRKAVHATLQSRRDVLRTKLSEAKQAVTLAQRKTTEFEGKISSLQKEIEGLRAQYVSDGVRERTKIISDAQSHAAQMIRDAERAANELVIRSKEELRRELLEKAVATVESRLTPERLAKLDQKLKIEALDGLQRLASH